MTPIPTRLDNPNEKILMSLDAQVAALNIKFDYMARDIKTLSEGMIERIAKTEAHVQMIDSRLTSIEKLNDELHPKEVAAMVEEDHQTLRDFKVIWKFMIASSATIGGFIGFIVTLLTNLFHWSPQR